MNILLCIDDTDEKGGPGTGHFLQALCETIKKNGWGECSAISRHQLFLNDAIPYTSHNSALCSEVTIQKSSIENITGFCGQFLEKSSAPGADPGLCITNLSTHQDYDSLIHFGWLAKQTVLTKNDAFCLAQKLNIHLSEHGGTGQGVIGALAGTGLRLSGNDGRFRGWYHPGRKGELFQVQALTAYPFIDVVQIKTGEALTGETIIRLGGDKLKTILKNGKQVLPVTENKNNPEDSIKWRTLTKQEVKQY